MNKLLILVPVLVLFGGLIAYSHSAFSTSPAYVIVSNSRIIGQTSSAIIINSFGVGTSDATFRINGDASHSGFSQTQINVSWTDENGNVDSQKLITLGGGTACSSNECGFYSFEFRAHGNTTITVSTIQTGTNPYNADATLEQIQ